MAWLQAHRIDPYTAWGYNFDWQSRAFFAPKGTPNAICTIFAASAFLEAFEELEDREYLETARESCQFILEHLMANSHGESHIRYVPSEVTQVHNVSMLGAALMSRLFMHTGDKQFMEASRKVMFFSIRHQNTDGSWYYGEAPNQRWIDNFHTGFNLVALARYRRYMGDNTVDEALRLGYEYWNRNFFLSNGVPKYYPNRVYPIDIHCAAQGIITYVEFMKSDSQGLDKACRIALWAIESMWSTQGFFIYQRHRWHTNSIPYMRWAQAWMLHALSTLLLNAKAHLGEAR